MNTTIKKRLDHLEEALRPAAVIEMGDIEREARLLFILRDTQDPVLTARLRMTLAQVQARLAAEGRF